MSSNGAYRALVRLYPPEFRARYGEDLVQGFADLAAERGSSAAWRQAAVDLAVTLPRYRLEEFMGPATSSRATVVLIALLAVAGAGSVLVDLYPGVVLLLVAAGLAVAQRSSLARSIRSLDPDRRRRRFLSALAGAVVFATSYVVFLAVIGDRWTARETALAVVGTVAMLAAIGFLIAALLTPRANRGSARPTAV